MQHILRYECEITGRAFRFANHHGKWEVLVGVATTIVDWFASGKPLRSVLVGASVVVAAWFVFFVWGRVKAPIDLDREAEGFFRRWSVEHVRSELRKLIKRAQWLNIDDGDEIGSDDISDLETEAYALIQESFGRKPHLDFHNSLAGDKSNQERLNAIASLLKEWHDKVTSKDINPGFKQLHNLRD